MQEQIVLRQSICEPQNNFANDKKNDWNGQKQETENSVISHFPPSRVKNKVTLF